MDPVGGVENHTIKTCAAVYPDVAIGLRLCGVAVVLEACLVASWLLISDCEYVCPFFIYLVCYSIVQNTSLFKLSANFCKVLSVSGGCSTISTIASLLF